MVLLNDKEWPGDRPVHLGDRITFKTITVPPPPAVAEELSGKPESSSFQIHVKADEKARVCTLRVGTEHQDLTEYIKKTFGWPPLGAWWFAPGQGKFSICRSENARR
jgi:hypothetical protein